MPGDEPRNVACVGSAKAAVSVAGSWRRHGPKAKLELDLSPIGSRTWKGVPHGWSAPPVSQWMDVIQDRQGVFTVPMKAIRRKRVMRTGVITSI